MFTSKQIRRSTMRQQHKRNYLIMNRLAYIIATLAFIGLGACADRNEKVTQEAGTPAVTAGADPAARLVLAERRILGPSVSSPE
jgi:hypothetical protein